MGDRAPSKHTVRTTCDGLALAAVTDIVRQINAIYGNSPLNPRADPWRKAQELIARQRSRV
jgi:hypothetical protein